MSRFAPFLSKIQEKLEEAKISDLNHELGKFAQESANYFKVRRQLVKYEKARLMKRKLMLFQTGSSKFWSKAKQKDLPSGKE